MAAATPTLGLSQPCAGPSISEDRAPQSRGDQHGPAHVERLPLLRRQSLRDVPAGQPEGERGQGAG